MCVFVCKCQITSAGTNASLQSDVRLVHNATSLLSVSLSSPFNLLSSFSPSNDLSMTPTCPYIPRPGDHWGQPDQGPWHGEGATHMRTRQWKKTARSSPLDVYSDIIQHIATRDPENMSYVIPFVVYLTLLETHRQTQISTDSHTPSLLHCIMSSVFLWPLCPSPERMVGALCLNPLFGPSGERDTILLASWLHQPPVWTPFKHT